MKNIIEKVKANEFLKKNFINYGISIILFCLYMIFIRRFVGRYYDTFSFMEYLSVVPFLIAIVIRIVSYFFIKDEREYNIPIEVLILSIAFLGISNFHIIMTFQDRVLPGFLFVLISYFVIFKSIQIMILYMKRGLFFKQFVLVEIVNNLDRVYKFLIAGIILIVLNLNFVNTLLIEHVYKNTYYIEAIPNILILLYMTKLLIDYKYICDDVTKISKGNFNKKIKSGSNFFESITNPINHINDGMQVALEEKVKSERLRTDLITNVSHDLKTPLTSIINYVKLLKNEKIEDKKINNYIDVIDKKSEHLKNLTDDLIEASKISSGYETPNLENIDITELVKQANGEFLEKFSSQKLEIVDNIPTEKIYLMLDSKKTWRVFDNIYSNIQKYSLKNTRVYIDLETTEDKVIFTIRNISKDKLNINPDELMERFVRGDSSRNTSGHGLGLSIAKNLIEIQGGTFNIYIEGDLFKVQIEFYKNV